MRVRKLLIKSLLLILTPFTSIYASQEQEIFESSRQFSTMWWLNSINKQKQFDFAIQTSHYGLVFDYNQLQINSLWVNNELLTQDKFYSTPSKDLIQEQKGSSFSFGIKDAKGHKTQLKSSQQIKNCQLVSAGRYVNKRFINELTGANHADKIISGLEVYSNTDCLSIIYKHKVSSNSNDSALFMDYLFPEQYNLVQAHRDGYVIVRHKNKRSGFVVYPSEGTSKISVSKGVIELETSEKEFKKGNDYHVGMVMYPLKDIDEELDKFIASRSTKITVEAQAITPIKKNLKSKYNFDEDSYKIIAHTEFPKEIKRSEFNEKIAFTLENNSQYSKSVKLDFSKYKTSMTIIGMSGVITDTEGNPTGLPVQISKNWHRDKDVKQRYEGSWCDMYSVIDVPANTKLELIFTYVSAYWGTLPATSHAQLSIVGWGSSVQLWEQSALGCWGENICYSPDGNVGKANITDVRASFIKNPKGEQFKWGGNIGGGDFINITDDNGERIEHENIRIRRVRYAPNLSEMVYYGDLAQGAASFEYTVMLARTNDMVKGRYNIKLKVHKNFNFSNFALFSSGAYRYVFALSQYTTLGNENGRTRERKVDLRAPQDNYIGKKHLATGENSWVAQTHTVRTDTTKLSANKGLVLREWDAKIGGKKGEQPYWGEFLVKRRDPRPVINLTVPNGCNELKSGDYINATIDFLIFHKQVDDYCADNEYFAKALSENPNSWEMVYREAKDNNYKPIISVGKVLREHPMKIEAKDNVVKGQIERGLAYEPITFTGLTTYKNPSLSIKNPDGKWIKVDQSKVGKDFWQCDYNDQTGKWEITYNIPLDREDNSKPLEFMFEMQ